MQDTRNEIDPNECKMDEQEAKSLVRKPKYVYVCPICNKVFNQVGKLKQHLSSKYLCSQRITIDYLRKEMKQNKTITSLTDQIDTLINEFLHLADLAHNIEYVKQCKNIIGRIDRKYRNLVYSTRLISICDYNDVHKFDDELKKYENIISQLKEKYALILY